MTFEAIFQGEVDLNTMLSDNLSKVKIFLTLLRLVDFCILANYYLLTNNNKVSAFITMKSLTPGRGVSYF